MEASRAYNDFAAERVRAHLKHGSGSTEGRDWDSPLFVTIVGEEFGELCKAKNEFALGNITSEQLRVELRKEAIQTGAMLASWIDSLDAL